nr:reverse transcriptase domain-containing protein [Tanacetum cinerariifolium]
MVTATEPKTMQKAMQISGALTDEGVRNGSIKKEERMWALGPNVPPAILTMHPEDLAAHASTVTTRIIWACYECGSIDHVRPACLRLNKAQGPGGNRPNQVVANNEDQDGKVLRVLREIPKEKARLLMSVKTSDNKQEEIVVVRDFPEVFLDDLSGLPPVWEIKFQIELIQGATAVAKSPYRLAPSKLEELSGQLKVLQDLNQRNANE